MAEVKVNGSHAGRKDSIEAARSAAYGAGFVAGQTAANAAADARADQFRREIGAVLLCVGEAIEAGDDARLLVWFSVLSKVFASGTN